MWRILGLGTSITVALPRQLNAFTMHRFVASVVDEARDARSSRVTFDFELLEFIEPVGVVALSNLIEYLVRMRCRVNLINIKGSKGVRYLDDSGFFERYAGRKIFPGSSLRDTTMPLGLITGPKATSYLYNDLIPWIGQAVRVSPAGLGALRASLEEVFHNVRDHSGVDVGCTFAQHFPNRSEIQIAISDFGEGIPSVVRTREPELDDVDALRMACREGFTTQSNVQNRGAGIPTLMRYVTQRNGGHVLIAAGSANVSATTGTRDPQITGRRSDFYPGTMVRVILRTNTLERLSEDVESEDFTW